MTDRRDRALEVALASLFCGGCAPLAAVGLVLGARSLRQAEAGRRRNRGLFAVFLSALVLAGNVLGLLFFAVFHDPVPESLERHEADRRATATLPRFLERLDAVQHDVEAVDWAALEDMPCDGASIEGRRGAADRIALVRSVDLAALATRRPAPRSTFGDPLGFLRDDTVCTLAEQLAHPTEGEAAGKLNLHRMVEIQKRSGSLLGVAHVLVDRRPLVLQEVGWIEHGRYRPGALDAWILVYDLESGRRLCQARVRTTSSRALRWTITKSSRRAVAEGASSPEEWKSTTFWTTHTLAQVLEWDYGDEAAKGVKAALERISEERLTLWTF